MKKTQREFGDIIDRSVSAIRGYETGEYVTLPASALEKLANYLKLSVDDLYKQLEPKFGSPDTKAVQIGGDGNALEGGWDQNVEPYSRVDFLPIPEFDLHVAAGDWSDASELGEICYDDKKSIVQQGLFRIKIRGDSMEKKWKDGTIVEFKCVPRDGSGTLDIGKDYCVVRHDEMATFKTLIAADDEKYTLKAINKKYKTPLFVERSLVTSMARAMAEIKPDI